ncbi:MAG TPA: SpoIIE family protein phosphatase [Streptosporangiaceae bacterium]|nr:SpoIIE family protein phosphatase [Streptosporangiaceae bacterium]
MTRDNQAPREPVPPNLTRPPADLDGLRSRAAALRQAAALPKAESQVLLDAALAELDGAIAALDDVTGNTTATGDDGRALSGLHSDRRLLHAVFSGTPVPLYVVDHDGTVLRANQAACELLGVGPGYSTGKSLTALIEPRIRAALRSQLAAAARSGAVTRLRGGMLAAAGLVKCEIDIRPLMVRGDADRLLVTVSSESAVPARSSQLTAATFDGPPAEADDGDAVVSAARRLDLLAAAARLLLAGSTVSESVLLQRAARLLTSALATWAMVDIRRRGQLRRHYVAGPDDPALAGLTQALAAVEPGPGSVPHQVYESSQTLLSTHLDDDVSLGRPENAPPLLAMLGGASVLAVPISDQSRQFGVLTLIRRADDGQFGMAEAALVEEVGALLGLAIAARRVLRQRTETADALRASLLPPVLKAVPGVEMASAHLAPTRGREVGGDFYDVYPTPGGWGVAIGDVCGKGEDAAAATAAARHAIRVLAHSTADPADVLRGANEIMLAEEFGGRFVTASAAHLSWRDGTLHIVLANAGHPAPVLIRPDGRTEQVPGGGVPLGIFPDPEPATTELELSDGDVLFYYTDGLADARSPQANYLEDRLTDSLAQLAGRPAADIVSDMQKVVLDFTASVLHDDLTMLVLRAGAAPGP